MLFKKHADSHIAEISSEKAETDEILEFKSNNGPFYYY